MIAIAFSLTALMFIASALALATTTAADIRKANTAKRLQTLRGGPIKSIPIPGDDGGAPASDPYIYIIPLQWRPNLKRMLDNAGDAVNLRSLVLVALVSGPIAGYFVRYFFHASVALIVIAVIAGSIAVPVQVVRIAQAKVQQKFLALFPDGVDLIVRAVRAGLPVTAALDAVGKEVPDPAGRQFRLLVADMKIGMTFEEAMRRASDRVNLLEFSFFTASLILQRETGGNLSETLETLGSVLRKRQEMVQKTKTLTAEARMSVYVMIALPFFVAGALMVVSPSYLTVYATDPRGSYILGSALGSLLLGYGTMQYMMAKAMR